MIDELSTIVTKLTNPSAFSQSTMVERYGSYLKERYLLHPAAVASHFQWPPPISNQVFNLAMIKKEKVQRGEISESFVRLNISGNIRKILNVKVPVDIADILKVEATVMDDCEFQERKLVLIEGAPGSGKSTLCVQICRKWSSKKLFQEYTAVILVRLRDPLVQKAKTLSDLLPCQTKQNAEDVAAEMCSNGGRGILWILDGWDEFPVELQENSVVKKLLQSDLSEKGSLYSSTVIITSRPISSGNLYHLVSSRVEVLGFTAVERTEYFKEALKGNGTSIETLIENIKQNPVVESSCYLPINASVVAHLLHCSENKSLPETQYEIFSALVCNIIFRHLVERTQCKVTKIKSLDDLPEVVLKPFQTLCKVAYQGVMSNKLTFSSSDLVVDPNNPESSTLDLLQGVESLVSIGRSLYYNFLHLTVQELLAAYHIAKHMNRHEQVSKFHELLHQPRFTTVFQFYAAITKLQTTGINAVVTSIIQSENKALLLSLLNCLYEMQDQKYCQSVSEHLQGELNLCSVSLDPMSCLSVGYFLSSVCSTQHGYGQFKALLNDCSISKDGCNLLMKGLSKHLSHTVTGNVKLSLDLSDNILMNDGVMLVLESSSKCLPLYKLDLSMRASKHHRRSFISPKSLATLLLQNTSLVELDLCNWKMKVSENSTSGPLLCQLLKKNQTLKFLVLRRSELGDTGASHIAEGIACNNTLNALDLSYCKITAQGLSKISQALVKNNSVQSLYLCNNLLSENCAPHLETILKVNKSIKKLSLSRCSLTSYGFDMLSSSLAVNSSLEVLYLSGNPHLGDGGALYLAGALQKNDTLKHLDLSYCHTASRGIEALSSALAINTSLEGLDVSGECLETLDINDHCATNLQQALMRNSTLKTLNLAYSSFTESSTKCLSLGLLFNNSLANLNLSNSVIDDASVAYLSTAIQHSESLKTLDLFNCHITDNGIELLAQCVATNRSLTEIRLARNDPISAKGVQLLNECLQKNVHSQLLTLRIPSHLESLATVIETDVNVTRKKSGCDLLKVSVRMCT